MDDPVAQAFREERPAVLATLIRHVGDFDLAEEAVQDAFAKAVETWPRDGVPTQPGAWLTVAARRLAIDRLRRAQAQRGRAERLAAMTEPGEEDGGRRPPAVDLHLLSPGARPGRRGSRSPSACSAA